MKIKIPTKLLTVAIAAAIPASLQAQQLEETLVTAQKRVESVQDIPVAVSAISADVIAELGLLNTKDIVRLAPSVTFAQANTPNFSSFFIRGIGTFVFSPSVEQSVAFMVDEVTALQPGQALANLVDIERVEILRGPQSTLFGKSASAGVISMTTKAPTTELEGTMEITATDDNQTLVSGAISGPITDTLRYRVSGHWDDQEGNIDNVTTGKDDNNLESEGVRAKLQWDITDSIQATLTGSTVSQDGRGTIFTWIEFPETGKLAGIVPGDYLAGIVPGDKNYESATDDGPYANTDSDSVILRFDADIGEFGFTSITAFDKYELEGSDDVDFSAVDIFSFFTGGAESGGFFQDRLVESDVFSQEFRLTSPSSDKFEYLLGLYYIDSEVDSDFVRNPGTGFFESNFVAQSGNELLAIFANSSFSFSESTSLDVGLRWSTEEISGEYTDLVVAGADKIAGSSDDDAVTGKISLRHYFREDIMAYLSYARGHKGQAYDLTDNFDPENPVAPEESDAFELGVKSRMWDNRLQLNAAMFYTKYEDFQADILAPDASGFVITSLENAGELITQGIELESIALLSEAASIVFNIAYIDSEVNDYSGAGCYTGQTEEQGCVDGFQDIDSGTLPRSPEWKYTIIGDYQLELTSMPFNGFANLSYTWQDDVIHWINQHPRLSQESYGVANLRFGISAKSDRYQVTLFVNNLFDEHYSATKQEFDFLFNAPFGEQFPVTGQIQARDSERYFGIKAKFNF